MMEECMFIYKVVIFKITKNADNSKNNYKRYGICFDERSEFGHTITEGGFTHTTDARNVLICGADMSFGVHATNRANNIYVMGTGLTQTLQKLYRFRLKGCVKFAL